MLESPYVRRVAVCMRVREIEFEHRPLSVFADFHELLKINPVVKVPALITDDNQLLIDSTLIITYLERISSHSFRKIPESGLEGVEDFT